MRIAINISAVRSLSPNERIVHKLLGEGLTPKEISRKMGLPLGMNSFTDNYHDIPLETIAKLITSIREKGWDIPTDKYKEGFEMKKLTEADKRNIVTARQAGAKVTDIAEKYGVHKSTIHTIINAWKKNGESAFAEVASDTVVEAYISAETEKEPASAATDTSSKQNIIPDNSTDIVPENPENVKPLEGNSLKPHTYSPAVVDAVYDCICRKQDEIALIEKNMTALYAEIAKLNEQISALDDMQKYAEAELDRLWVDYEVISR